MSVAIDGTSGVTYPDNSVQGTAPPTLAHGTYTPTITNTTNITNSTAYVCQYLRVGNTVIVSGSVFLTFTAYATASEIGISLPIASNLAQAYQLAGTSCTGNGVNVGAIQGDATNDRGTLKMTSPASPTTTGTLYFQFTYQVI